MPSKDEEPPQGPLAHLFAKQGVTIKVQKKMSEGGEKQKKTSWLEDEEMKLGPGQSSFLVKTVKEVQKDGEFQKKAKVGGSYDKHGQPRKNVGGRPKTHTDQSYRNMSRRQRLRHAGPKKAQRKEVF